MVGRFLGFAPQSFEFFRELAKHNYKGWFDAHRELYDAYVTGAMRGLLAELEPFLLELNPNFETSGKTNGNFSRINRDIRFSKDKSPYKSNYYLRVYDAQRSHQTDGCLYVGLSADAVTVGFACYGAWGKGEKSVLDTVFRPRFASHRTMFDGLLERVVGKGRYETYWHRQEKKEWAQHAGLPRRDDDWQTLQAWVVRKVFTPESREVGSPKFAAKVQAIFRGLYPLYVFTSVTRPEWQRNLRALA
ncbi:MAG TPA: DUF2461 family protein [Terriglobia bacterium]|nr:DUF2461 family protein [Terriglobia bacterium]